MSQNFETDSKDEHFLNDLPLLDSDVHQKTDSKNRKHFHKNNDRRNRRPDMKLYVPPKAKNSVSESDMTCVEDETSVEELEQKTDQTVESLSELEITDSSHERDNCCLTHSSNSNQSKSSSNDCTQKSSLRSPKCEDIPPSDELNRQNTDESIDESSWDSMFDENGECIQSDFIDKVNGLIGGKDPDIKLEKTRIDYLSFQYNEPEIDNSEFAHILEVYDFAVDLKTQDIMTAISVFNCRDFDIKWVDDTHALVVFSNTNAANEALKYIYPNIKLRPLSQAIRESKVKARKCSEFLQPYKQRPQTSASLARRLVTQSLGLRDRITPEQRAAERKKLAEAKERKRLAIKQGQDVWEGNV